MKTKELIRPMPATWWLRNRYLVQFMIRELTSVFVAGYAVFLLVMVSKAAQGDRALGEFFAEVMATPTSIALQLLALLFVLYHTITWFNLTPKALVVFRGEERVSPFLIAGVNYVAWVVVSVAIFYVAVKF